jgi:hypothetical protein
MRNRLFHKMISRTGWELLLRERLSEPLHLNFMALFVALFGSVRAKIYFDLIVRQQHAYALLASADLAKQYGFRKLTAIEFGVADGAGLLNICKIAQRITGATGIEFNIIGFDAGSGMPEPVDYRDHPEYYATGDFEMQAPDALRRRLPDNAQLVIGNVRDTVPRFLNNLSSEFPIGFVSIDVDYYSSTVDALKILEGDPNLYLPMVEMYLDDVDFPGHSEFAGEILAAKDFSAAHEMRKISTATFLREHRLFKNAKWISHMYRLHVFDHPKRATARQGIKLLLGNPELGVKRVWTETPAATEAPTN